jgi:hypothetical protein
LRAVVFSFCVSIYTRAAVQQDVSITVIYAIRVVAWCRQGSTLQGLESNFKMYKALHQGLPRGTAPLTANKEIDSLASAMMDVEEDGEHADEDDADNAMEVEEGETGTGNRKGKVS